MELTEKEVKLATLIAERLHPREVMLEPFGVHIAGGQVIHPSVGIRIYADGSWILTLFRNRIEEDDLETLVKLVESVALQPEGR